MLEFVFEQAQGGSFVKSTTPEIQPNTFQKLFWVANIDDPTLTDCAWVKYMPDGKELLKSTPASVIRDRTKHLLQDKEWKGDEEYNGLLDLLGVLRYVSEWVGPYQEALRPDIDILKRMFPEFPYTIRLFWEHAQVTAEYWLQKSR